MAAPVEALRSTNESPFGRAINTANRLGNIDTRQVQFKEASKPNAVAQLIEKSLKRKELIVIDDRTHGEVVGLKRLSDKRIEVVRIGRWGSLQTSLLIINSPRVEATLSQGVFSLAIFGTPNGRKREEDKKPIIKITSNGEYSPPAFVIGTEQELLFGRRDVRGSFTGAWAHLGAKWVVRK